MKRVQRKKFHRVYGYFLFFLIGLCVGGLVVFLWSSDNPLKKALFELQEEKGEEKAALNTIKITDTEDDASVNDESKGDLPMPEDENTVELSFDAARQAEEILNEMTIEEKVGQMFIVRCPKTDAVQKASEYHLGGYILFGRDFSEKTKDEVVETIKSYQEAVEIPLLIGVDEEGGTVNRISTNPRMRAVPFWSPQELYAEGGFELIQSDTQEKCELLRSLGTVSYTHLTLPTIA